MELRALGPLAALRDGEELDLGAPRQRAVFALLLVHRNDALPADRILEELWGDEAEGKLNALRVYVSRLRDALEPDRERYGDSALQTVGDGYRLDVDDNNYDVAEFERLVTAGKGLLRADPAGAAATLRSALELWRGPPFADFSYDNFVQTEAHRLSEMRVDAIEDRVDADIATGLGGELVTELEALRRRHPLRERLAAQQALALYRSGRPAEALRAISRFRRHVGEELGIDPSPRLLRLEEQILLHDERIQPPLPSPEALLRSASAATNPFKGLRSFGTADVGTFFGRDALIAELLRTIGTGQRLVAIVGASGSGKSSAVHAGLLPALSKGAIEGSDEWSIATMTPGAHPFAELEAALLRSTPDAPAGLGALLDDGETGLLRAVLRLLPRNKARFVVAIDQFEELFTLVDDSDLQDRFLSNLVTASDDPHGRIIVVLTLRADFYGRPLSHPEFGARLGAGVVNVTPLSAEELEAAALLPAEQQGVSFEPALLGELIADVRSRPGSLPLFQYALTELFDRRVGSTLTAASYRAMGGVEGALERRASNLYDELDDARQDVARQVFLRLAVVTDDDQRSRRRVTARELVSIGPDTSAVQDVLRIFGEHRLLSFDADPLTGAPTVEVAHEALLTAWPRLDTWIDVSRADLRRHASLLIALREWELADEATHYLLPPERLGEFERWEESSAITLNGPERDFLERSFDRSAELDRAETLRRTDATRARRRLWALVGSLALALGAATLVLLGVFAPGTGPSVTYFYNGQSTESINASIRVGVDRADRELRLQIDYAPFLVDASQAYDELTAEQRRMVIFDANARFYPEAFFATFPEALFGVIEPDPEIAELPNVASVAFDNEQAGFLAGVAAAMKTESRTVGFVGGQPFPEIEEFRAGFEAGVWSIDLDIDVLATFVDQFDNGAGFVDPVGGQARARALYDRGADVVFHAAGASGRGVFLAADEGSGVLGRHLWGIGVDVDEWQDVRPGLRDHVLTSVVKRHDIAVLEVAKLMIATGAGKAPDLGLAQDGFGVSRSGGNLSAAMIATLDERIDEVVSGQIVIPTEPEGPVLVLDDAGNEIDQPTDDGD
jgi:basic membrane lipoprotein Med (substrate-binding protein (PBP1-ABC) superfamily)/DNA-binding SARP family transcriptional activator